MENHKTWGGKRANAGRKPVDPEKKRRQRSFSLTDNEYDFLCEFAKEKRISPSMLISEWINEKLSNE